MRKTTFNSKYLKLFFLIFTLTFFNTTTYAQCAGDDNSITICDKETYNQGIGNPDGVLNLYILLGGVPTPGGIWSDVNGSGGLNPTTGLLNTWQINRGGVFNYQYTVTGVPGCIDSISIITLTLGGFPGFDDTDNACISDTSVNLFSSLGNNPNPNNNGTWSGPPGTVTGSTFNPQIAGLGTFLLTYTVPAVGPCGSDLTATVTMTVQPLPNAGVPTPLTFCETDDFSAFTNVDLFGQLSGEDNGGFWADTNATGELSGSGDSFINIQNIANTFGAGTYTFTYTVDASHPICEPSTASVIITIEPVVDLNGATLIVAPNICFSEIGTTAIIGTITQGATPIPDGTYNITYVLSPPNNNTETVPVTFSGGIAQFTINPAFLTAVGTIGVEITTVIDTNTSLNCTRTITNLTGTFIINENPNISDSQLSIVDICLGQSAQGQISDFNGPAIELSDGTYSVTFDITGPNGTVTGQTAAVTINGGNGIFNILSTLTPIDGNYTVTITNILNTVTNCSSTAGIPDSFIVSPIPDAVIMAVTIDDVCDGENVIVNISGASNLTDGLYTINYDVTGAINAPSQVASNVLFTSGNGSFTLPVGILNIGVSTLTVTNLLNSTSTCETTTFSNPSGSFEIHALPNAGDIDITVADVCVGQSGTVQIFDTIPGIAPELTNGDYTITYDISGANIISGQTVVANINNGVGSFPIPSTQLTNIGANAITIVIITNNNTGCDAIGVPISTNFDVLENPIIDNVSITVSQPICQGQSGTASITGAVLIDGNYDLNYDINGANIVTGQVVSVVFAAGNTTFNIPTLQIPNVGNYTISITNIVNNNTPNACNSPVINVQTAFTVSENPDTSNTTLTALDPVCLGTNGQITLTDLTSTLSDGNYNLVYDISGVNSASNVSANVTISSGTGSLSVPASSLTNLGNTTVTITSITNSVTNCSSVANLFISFEVIPLPDTTGATLTVTEPICLGNNASAQINGPALTDGSYTLTYDLSGANSSVGNTATVIFASSNGSFSIPSTLLTNSGNTSIILTLLTNNTTGCVVQGLSIPDSFIVSPIPTLVASETTIADICIGNNAVVAINSPVGLIDGNYQLDYLISGANGPSNQTATFTVTGGLASFDILNTLLTNSGSTIITFNSITNLGTTCTSPLGFNVTFMVNPLPDVNPNQFVINDICLGQSGTGIISNATNLVNSDYTVLYNLTGANIANNQSAIIPIVSGGGSFTIPASLLTNPGSTSLTIVSITNNTTGCTTSPIFINYTFLINPLPDTTGATATVTEPICLGSIATVQINGPGLTNGSYTLTFDLSGANSSVGNAATVVIAASNGSFTIPSALLTNAGNTTVTINLQTNSTTGCVVQGPSIPDSFIVSPIPTLVASETTIADICIGNNAVVVINSPVGLIDGNYQLDYLISGANGPSNQTATFTVTGGLASFDILNTLLTNSGSTIITFNSITNLGTTCTSPLGFNVTFMVNPLPDVNPNQFVINDICLGQSGTGIISNATNLVNSDYTVLYNLTGANIANNQSAIIPIVSGGGSFTIPASLLTNPGSTSLTIVSITNNTTGCTTSPIFINYTFLINPLPDTTGATATVTEPICLGSIATVQINGPGLTNGSYTLTFDLSGANSSVGNAATVVIAASNGSFTIPSALLTNAGNTTVTITLQTNSTTGCVVQGPSIPDSFIVSPIPTLVASETTIADICIGNNAVVVINSPVGIIDGNYQLDYLISGANGPSNQTATFTVTGGLASFDILNTLLTNSGSTIITFNSITNLGTTCTSPLGFNVTFMVNPLPDVNPNQFVINDICLGQSGTGIISNATNLVNSDYTVLYNLTGANIANNQSAIIPIVSGGGSFTIPASLLTNPGSTSLTIVSITNNTTGCTTSPIGMGTGFDIITLPDTSGITINVTDPICSGNGTIATITSTSLADGTYTVNYDITNATSTVSGSTTIVIAGGINTTPPFVIQASEISIAGNYTISITAITSASTLCPGTSSPITDGFVVNPSPTLLASEVTITDICIGNNADVYINTPSGLIAGNYQLDYTITNTSGTSPTQTVVFTVPGSPAFSIPSALLTTAGATTIDFISITNTDFTPNCSSALSFSAAFMVNPLPTIISSEITVGDVCLGQDGEVIISDAANLEDSDYIFTYNIVNGASSSSNLTSPPTTVNGGDGTFSIPATALPNSGPATITITGILNTITGCSTSGLVVDYSFTVNTLPNVTGADVSVSNICINSDAEVSITGATGLINGNYTLVYDLSGANTSTDNSISVLFNTGASGFTIPAALLINGGSTVITIQSFSSDLTQCGANTITLNPESFTITDPQTATIDADGNLFCIQDRPTISDLTSNVDGNGTITWYNAPSGGNAYNDTDALVNDTTYYATVTDGTGCVSSTRLEVTVDLTACGDLFIPDGFSPNGDASGLNEEFYIKNIDVLYPQFELEIYNRYGNMVYKGNINTPNFNGKANQTTIVGDDVLPTGVYFYILNFNDASNTKPKQGRLYLSR